MNAPKVVFIGRPNVGKSSLLNRVFGHKVQIVSNVAGTTVDIVYRLWESEIGSIHLIDTIGVLVEKQCEEILHRVSPDLVVLVVDASHGLLPVEKGMQNVIRKLGFPFFTVFNKVDLVQEPPEYANSKDELFVSAKSGKNVTLLKESIIKRLSEQTRPIKTAVKFTLSLVGRTNVGKSSIFNSIAGEDMAKISSTPHTTRDFLEAYVLHHKKLVKILDCAGFKKGLPSSKLEAYITERIDKAIILSDICAFICSFEDGITNFDKRLITRVLKRGLPSFVVVNKIDLRPGSRRNSIEKDFTSSLPSYLPIVFVSALQKIRVSKILDIAEEIVERYRNPPPADEVKRAFYELSRQIPAPFSGNKPNILQQVDFLTTPRYKILLKFRFPQLIEKNLLRLYEKKFRSRFPFAGIPLQIALKPNDSRKYKR
ncbi:MAG: 50S ribosome-binding GTPase [Deltaproteobacteria bacterium]|nr:50S ribosome-binding GTPase [Deltaproteobacteria bacterium]MCX7953354.1 50S ribosome-binding GTPase [Deltaproteobacteria bacterium]